MLLLLVFSCKENTVDRSIPEGMLYKITKNGKTVDSLSYEGGRLKKQFLFSGCDYANRTIVYNYRSDRLNTVEFISRASSNTSYGENPCDPSAETQVLSRKILYGSDGRISGFHDEKHAAYYFYNGLDILMEIRNGDTGKTVQENSLKLDAFGNLLEMATPSPINGGITRYEYDDKVNPYKRVREFHYDGLTAYNGPNNVVKAFDADGRLIWERKFTYRSDGQPQTCLEPDGVAYEYHYRQ